LGVLLSQSKADKGAGLGPGVTSAIFLACIVLTVTYLTWSKRDVLPAAEVAPSGAVHALTNDSTVLADVLV
jgi:hypothetical protein